MIASRLVFVGDDWGSRHRYCIALMQVSKDYQAIAPVSARLMGSGANI